MKVEFKIMYNNGVEDITVQEGSKEELEETIKAVEYSLHSDTKGILVLGNKRDGVYRIRLSDVSRVLTNILGE